MDTYHVQDSLLWCPRAWGLLTASRGTCHTCVYPSGSRNNQEKVNITAIIQYFRAAVHEKMCSDIALRCVTQFMSKTFSERFDSSLGRVVCRIASIVWHYTQYQNQYCEYDAKDAHGGLVIPCFEPVLMIADWFS